MLSDREKQVLDLMLAGHTATKDIAYQMKLSPRTVEIYRGGLLHKMGARNACDLMRRALINRDEQR